MWRWKVRTMIAPQGTGHASTTLVAPDQLTALTGPIFEEHIGLQFHAVTTNYVRASLTITPSLWQATGVTHGGLHCSMAESAASVGATIALNGMGYAIGINNNTDFLAQVKTAS